MVMADRESVRVTSASWMANVRRSGGSCIKPVSRSQAAAIWSESQSPPRHLCYDQIGRPVLGVRSDPGRVGLSLVVVCRDEAH
jgi:hypothetical protein